MHDGELQEHDHDLAKHCSSQRARRFVEKDACDALIMLFSCSVVLERGGDVFSGSAFCQETND